MTAEIICVGTEILLGDIVDTNSALLGKVFAECGIVHLRRQVVGANLGRLTEALKESLSRADLVVTIGGLGPTEDDLTRDGIAAALESPLIEDQAVLAHLKERVRGRNYPWVESMARQAQRPECAEVIRNEFGSAPGLLCRKGGKAIIAMPGPKGEFGGMLAGPIQSILRELSGTKEVFHSRTLRIVGLGESMVEERVRHLMSGSNPTVAPYAKDYEVHLRITAAAKNSSEAEGLIAPVENELRHILGGHVYGIDSETLAQVVVRLLKQRGETVATAESCTGGLICGAITDVSGASGVLRGGIVAYIADIKQSALGVSQQTIEEHTVYSEAVAMEMAEGVRQRLNSTWGVGITGVAGPDADGNVPAGSVWIALAGGGKTHVEALRLPGSRDDVRRRSVMAALNLLRKTIERKSS